MLFSNLYSIKKSFIKRLLGRYWERAVQYFVEKLFFVYAICGKAHLTNLRIYDCGIGPRICGFAICGLWKKFACPPLLSAGFQYIYVSTGDFLVFYVRYSKLLHLPPLRFQGVGRCWGRTQDCCYCTLALTARCSNHSLGKISSTRTFIFSIPADFLLFKPMGLFRRKN